MKKTITLLVLTLIMATTAMGQNYTNGSITLKNNSLIEGRVAIDYASQTVMVKKDYKVTSYSFEQIVSTTLNNRRFNKIQIADIPYFAAPLEDGNASLYQINESQYLVTIKAGESRVIDLVNDRARIPGILAVLFSDCNSIRRSLNNVDEYNEPALLLNVQAYNICDYDIYAPTPKEIDAAASYNTDLANFYLGAGTGLSNISFFDRDDSETVVSAQLQLGVIATPSFLGTLQGNLYFSLEGNAAFANDANFSNVDNDVNFKVSSYRLLFGIEYQFNKEGKFKPFIGASVGPSGDYYEGAVDGNSFDISGGNPIFVPRIGARYLLKNGAHLGATLSYITGYQNDLTFPTEDEIIPLIVDVDTFTFGVSYYF